MDPPEDKSCQAGAQFGNPIAPVTGEKIERIQDLLDPGAYPLAFERIYRSNRPARSAANNGPVNVSGFGGGWTHNHATFLMATAANSPATASVQTPWGPVRAFTQAAPGGAWQAMDHADTLTDSGSTWTYRRADDDVTQVFAKSGLLLSESTRDGHVTAYAYVGDRLTSVTGPTGRVLNLSYDGSNRLSSVGAPGARSVQYGYDTQGRLVSGTRGDGTTEQYVYGNATFAQLLTGKLDELGNASTFTYDAQGRALSSEKPGGVDRYAIDYSDVGTTNASVTGPIGTPVTYLYSKKAKQLAVMLATAPSSTGGNDAFQRTQNANGLIDRETDFKGVRTDYIWDTARRLPTSVTRAAGTADATETKTQWHANFALPVLVTQAGRTTAYTYDAQGRLLSRLVTDTSASPNTSRTWSWSYDANGLVETATQPNGAVTHYSYDSAGNALSATNALGHAIHYVWDSGNRLTSQADPNGLVTAFTWDARDRLLTRTTGSGALAQTTTYTYNLTGTLATAALPNGLQWSFSYDAASRLIGWSNNRGEQGAYTLDAMGNRVSEQIGKTGGAVAYSLARTVNGINRVTGVTQGQNQSTSFSYDANGEPTGFTNGLNQRTSYMLDGLRRVKTVTDAANASASLAYNALGAVTQASDFKGVTTTYGRDAAGNATAENSADQGGLSTQYDALGLPSQLIDALGQATTITRDALGRLTSLAFADGKTSTLRYDLTPSSRGYLSEIVDRSGVTEYTRDTFGRVTLKTQTLVNGSVQQLSYGYNANGTLASIGYPGGATLTHVYDATGRLSGLNWNGSPLVSGIAWNPMGKPVAWTWAFASPAMVASRSYDTAGRMTTTDFSSYVYDAAGRITSLTQGLYGPADADPAHNTIAAADLTWAVGYDNVGRITSFNATDNTAGFGYDANGNRSSSMRVRNGQTTERAYTADTASNRLSGFAQTINGASNTSVVYGYNANGDLVSDGLRSFTYDAEGRLAAATTGASDTSPTTRYAHNALGQRVFKTDPLYPPAQGDENDPGFMQSLMNFFTRLWSPVQADAEKLGSAYVYDEQGTLLSELGTGGANGTDRAQYIYLPTANGPMPIAFIVNGTPYAVYSDHLNTPRKLTNADGLPVWQWNYSAFGEDKPTILKNRFADLEVKPNPGMTGMSEVKFNLRYPGQYYDQESGLNYNYFRSYNATTGRYSQGDPIGLDGGWNRFGYVDGNPLGAVDPAGLAACMVEFPDMPIDTGLGFSSTSLGGHGGVLGYGSDGATRYYEYGRYPPNASGVIGERLPADDGNYRRLGVPNLKMGRDGEPTPASLDALKGALSRGAGKGTPVTLTCTKDANEKKVYDYAEQLARNKSRPAYSWKPWSANQCRTFARDALGASR
ncbi:hypothetical protein A9977_00520 [Variovorax sp. UMC13]|nr:hypothetical protein [Variovorax sp. UMC13]